MFTNCCTLSTFCQDLVASAPNQRLFDDSVLFLGLFPILPVYLWLIALATGCPYSLDKCKTIIVVFKAPHFQCWNIGLLPLCNDTCMNLAAFVCLFPVWLWLRRSPCAWVDAVPAISGGLPPCSPNSCHLGNKPWELHWEVTQAWWWTSLSQKTLNASEGPHHVAVTISTVGRWRTSMVNKREQLSFSTVSPRLLQQASPTGCPRQGQPFPSLLQQSWELSPAALYDPFKATVYLRNGATADPSHVFAPYMRSYGISETDTNWISNKRYHHSCYSGEWPILWKLTLPYTFVGAHTGLIVFGYGVAFLTEK